MLMMALFDSLCLWPPPTTRTHRRHESTVTSDCILIRLAGAEGYESGYSSRGKMKKDASDSWKRVTFKEIYAENIQHARTASDE